MTNRQCIEAKWQEKSHKMIMAGYAKNHVADTYRMYHPKTKHIIETHGVKWADWMRPDPQELVKELFTAPEKQTDLAFDSTISDEEEIEFEMEEGRIEEVIEEDADEGGFKTPQRPIRETRVGERRPPREGPQTRSTQAPKVTIALWQLEIDFNPAHRSTMISVNVFEQNGNKEIYFVVNTELQNDEETPKTLQEAIDGPEGEMETDNCQ